MADASDHHRPGEPPPVRDEAADTPLWLPLLGLCFLVLGAFAVIWRAAGAEDEAAAAQEAAAPEQAQGAEADGDSENRPPDSAGAAQAEQ